jgi:hypothetical protein
MNEWVWSIGGMVLTGETGVLGEKPVPALVPPRHLSHTLAQDRTQAPWDEAPIVQRSVKTSPKEKNREMKCTGITKPSDGSLTPTGQTTQGQ